MAMIWPYYEVTNYDRRWYWLWLLPMWSTFCNVWPWYCIIVTTWLIFWRCHGCRNSIAAWPTMANVTAIILFFIILIDYACYYYHSRGWCNGDPFSIRDHERLLWYVYLPMYWSVVSEPSVSTITKATNRIVKHVENSV